MISVNVYRNNDKHIRGFKVSGHAGFDNAGHDIICSAVSVLTINTVNAIQEFLPDELITVNTDKESGLIECYFDDEPSERAVLLLNTFLLGIKGVRDQYGSKYLKLTDR